MILLPTNLVFRRFVGSFVLSCSTNDAAACAEDPRAQLATLQTHTGGTAWGMIRDEWGGQNRVKKASAPFLVEKTHAPSSAMPFAVPPPASPYARTDTPLRIPHSASSQFRLPPSPLPTIHISIVFVREGKTLFAFPRKPRSSHSFLHPRGEQVKTKTKHSDARVDWGRQVQFLLIVDITPNLGEPKIIR